MAHAIQGLVKYHGLKNPRLRIPYHDSISVCIKALKTTTTVEVTESSRENEITVNGKEVTGRDMGRAEIVLDRLRRLAKHSAAFKVVSENSLKTGKGLGFSASGFAALGLAASAALGLRLDGTSLSEIVRLGAGSSTRSLAGGFAIWYSSKGGRSYAEELEVPECMPFSMVIVPIASDVKTDEAHGEVLSSPLFKARLRNISLLIREMRKAILKADVAAIGQLAEEDTLNLHAITMTGKSRMVLWEPETVRIIKEVIRLREEGTPAWYSMDTGPSVFINTHRENAHKVVQRMREIGFKNAFISGVGGKPFLSRSHLF